jgi:hypothetical protein
VARSDRLSRLVARLRRLPADPGGRTYAPLALVATAVIFNLWVLRAQALPVLTRNDSVLHLSMVRWALMRLREGHLPFDGWYPYLGLGSALFHHYQSLPHTLTAGLALVVGADRAYFGTLYLLLSSWPISVYLGARLLGWERLPAAAAALLSPLIVSTAGFGGPGQPGFGYEHGAYVWQGYGMWSQLWAMWLLPLAWGLSWRAVSGTKPVRYAIASLIVGLTAACHFLTGYLAFLAIGVWVLIRPSDLRKRLARAALIGVGSLLMISWVVVPLMLDGRWISQSRYLKGAVWFDSFGARRVLIWLFTGKLFDGPRPIPVISMLVALGAAICIARFRQDERARALLGVMGLSLVLFFGRPTLGPLLKLLPGSDDLLLHRYIMGVHLAGIMLAGVGATWLGREAIALLRRLTPGVAPAATTATVVLFGIAMMAPAWGERWGFDARGGEAIHSQRSAEATKGSAVRELVEEAQARGPGRIYAGSSLTFSPGSWGLDYRLGSVPMYAVLAGYGADSVGDLLRTTSLSSDFEVLFDDTNPAQYDLFGIRYLILPSDRTPPVVATRLDERDGNTLWEVEMSGYVGVVDAVGPPFIADRGDLSRRVGPFLGSDELLAGRYPTIAFGGEPAAPPTVTGGEAPTGPAGSVLSENDSLPDGEVTARVVANRPAMVLLKSSFDPRWQVIVDGVSTSPAMVAPSFVGVEVSAGSHEVTLRYRPFPRYDVLFAIGLLAFLGLWFGQRTVTRKRYRRATRPGHQQPHTPAPREGSSLGSR